MATATDVVVRDDALANVPTQYRSAIREVASDRSMNDAMKALAERSVEFESPLTMVFAAIAMNPAARDHMERLFDREWENNAIQQLGSRERSRPVDEVVVGGGLHAAIYSAVRVLKGFPLPLVLEASPRAGGVFASSRKPSFYLNSRNRPGKLALPGTRSGALNVLPGAVVQPSHLSGAEYQVNSDVAWSIRTTLAMFARVRTSSRVVGIERAGQNSTFRLRLEDGSTVRARRVIDATGLGDADTKAWSGRGSDRLLSFPQLMARLDETFPLRGLDRVAVIGNGDSGRTAVEALTGQGPSTGWSVPAIDWPDQIDWYGQDRQATSRSAYEECNRSRYKGIARLFPAGRDTREARLVARPTADDITEGYDCVYVNERPYDYAIDCTGFVKVSSIDSVFEYDRYRSGGRTVARKAADEAYRIGPAASLVVDSPEAAVLPSGVPENTTAIFRYASRTAALAAKLPSPKPEPQVLRGRAAFRLGSFATSINTTVDVPF